MRTCCQLLPEHAATASAFAFKYQDRAGSPSLRTVEPHRLVHTGYRWYLVAWDSIRKDWRTFRMDRIEGKPKTSTRFTPRRPPEGDFAKFVSKASDSSSVSHSRTDHAAGPTRCPSQAHPDFRRSAGVDRSEFVSFANRV